MALGHELRCWSVDPLNFVCGFTPSTTVAQFFGWASNGRERYKVSDGRDSSSRCLHLLLRARSGGGIYCNREHEAKDVLHPCA